MLIYLGHNLLTCCQLLAEQKFATDVFLIMLYSKLITKIINLFTLLQVLTWSNPTAMSYMLRMNFPRLQKRKQKTIKTKIRVRFASRLLWVVGWKKFGKQSWMFEQNFRGQGQLSCKYAFCFFLIMFLKKCHYVLFFWNVTNKPKMWSTAQHSCFAMLTYPNLNNLTFYFFHLWGRGLRIFKFLK